VVGAITVRVISAGLRDLRKLPPFTISRRPYLLGGRCAQRCPVLHDRRDPGRRRIRCCIMAGDMTGLAFAPDIPAEKQREAGHSDRRIRSTILRKWWFAYLGEQSVADVRPAAQAYPGGEGVRLWLYTSVWDCNWFRTSKIARGGAVSVAPHLGQRRGSWMSVTTSLPPLFHIRKPRRHPAGRPAAKQPMSASRDWTFPHHNHVVRWAQKENPGSVSAWPTPITDGHQQVSRDPCHRDSSRSGQCLVLPPHCSHRQCVCQRETHGQYGLGLSPMDHYDRVVSSGVIGGVNEIWHAEMRQDYVALRGQGVTVTDSRGLRPPDAGSQS